MRRLSDLRMFLKITMPISFAVCLAFVLLANFSYVNAQEQITLTPAENHHIAELNSNQPYVAGYHVDTPDLYTRERVQATAITVSFPSTQQSFFPSDSWLGAGMFVQAQDSKYINVDYGFYTMLVVDSTGKIFLDLGFHQTRESTAPVQVATSELLYAYTWEIFGIEPSTPVTLLASWDSDGFVHYSLSISQATIPITSINVASLPNCENIIRKFYAGTVVAGMGFPFGHYAFYFQFGVISSQIIADNHWTADLKEPRILRNSGWSPVETAWSTQGDICYLDYDWKWGGAPYEGVSARYLGHPLMNPNEVMFFYNGETLPRGTILWKPTNRESTLAYSLLHRIDNISYFSVAILIVSTAVVMGLRRVRGNNPPSVFFQD
jgi:hypothetical protein